MRRLVLLFITSISLITLHANGYYSTSELNIQLWNNKPFKVVLDNQPFAKTSYFTMANITPGSHRLKIVTQKHNHKGAVFTKVLYNGFITISPNTIVSATVKPNFNLAIFSQSNSYFQHSNWSYGSGNTSCGCNHQYFNKKCNNGCSNSKYNKPMGHKRFNRLLGVINQTSFDKSRLMIAKQALNNNLFTTVQVTQIMQQFSFESTKLKFAKKAYLNTVDKNNYYLVHNEFAFNSSIKNLTHYINNLT